MYPFPRMIWHSWKATRQDPLPYDGTHHSTHICMPWDLDIFVELNNGRTLTLFDLGRFPLGIRVGLTNALRANKWSMAVAGVSVRYRRRVKLFNKIQMKSRGIGWDDKFLYIEQTMWLSNGECANHALIRMAVTGKSGIVNAHEVAKACGFEGTQITPPAWAQNWIDAEATRPWPPMQDNPT